MWSPRELAELAGTSRRAVRHYADIGLLPDPDRQSNGYGRYGVEHLIRLLRIRRLSSLGLTLPQIAALGDAAQPPVSLVRELSAQLTEQIDELERARQELAGMLESPGPPELPSDVAQRVAELPSAERALVVVLSRLLDDEALEAYVGLLTPYRVHPSMPVFDDLGADAVQGERDDLARALARHFDLFRSQHAKELGLVDDCLRRGVQPKQRTVDAAVRELYNGAQRDVLRRLHEFLPSTPDRSPSQTFQTGRRRPGLDVAGVPA